MSSTIGFSLKIIRHKSNQRRLNHCIDPETLFVYRLPLGKSPRKTSSSDANDKMVPEPVLSKFRKSCAAYCTAGFIIGLGQ